VPTQVLLVFARSDGAKVGKAIVATDAVDVVYLVLRP